MNVGLDHRGVDTECLAVFQTEFNGCLHHRLIDSFQRRRGQPIEGAVEGIVLGDAVAVKLRKAVQGIAIVDALAQFAIVPAFDAHECERAEGLLGGDPTAPRARVLQVPLEIAAHLLDQGWLLLQELRDATESGVELEALVPQFQIGEAELGFEDAAHYFFFSGRSSWWFNWQMRSKVALSLR